MNLGVKTIIYPTNDLEKSKALFNKLLGAAPIADSAYYVGWRVEGQDVGLDPNGFKTGMTGPVAFYHVGDIKQMLKTLLDSGATLVQDVKNVGGGRLIASVKDAD